VRAQAAEGIEVEHIVVDGGSHDGSAAYARAQGCQVMGREKPGVTFAINKGVAHAKGRFVSMLGCDDRLLPGGLALVARAFQSEGRPWIISACRWLDPAGVSLGDQPAAPSWISAGILSCLGWNCIPHVASFIQPEFQKHVGNLDESFTYAPDYEFACRALAAGHKFSRIPESAVAMLRHGANMSMQRRPEHLAELAEIQRLYGPASKAARAVNRYALKLWLNSASPGWFLQKRRGGRRPVPPLVG
jgi:glycosyltransferase involved in cell wall biosynthesis